MFSLLKNLAALNENKRKGKGKGKERKGEERRGEERRRGERGEIICKWVLRTYHPAR